MIESPFYDALAASYPQVEHVPPEVLVMERSMKRLDSALEEVRMAQVAYERAFKGLRNYQDCTTRTQILQAPTREEAEALVQKIWVQILPVVTPRLKSVVKGALMVEAMMELRFVLSTFAAAKALQSRSEEPLNPQEEVAERLYRLGLGLIAEIPTMIENRTEVGVALALEIIRKGALDSYAHTRARTSGPSLLAPPEGSF